jgi:two-component system phosphate regulon sensor histidine kinase PhoR
MSENESILLILPDPSIGQLLKRDALQPAGYAVNIVSSSTDATALVREALPGVIILNDQLENESGLELGSKFLEHYPQLPIILMCEEYSAELALEALRRGFVDFIQPTLHPKEIQQSVKRALERRQRLEAWSRRQTKRNTQSLKLKLNDLEALQDVSRKVTSLLDLDSVLAAVVDAVVETTGAEESSLLLLDESNGELYMRAARNFQDEFVHTFRLPVEDSLAGKVIETGEPVLISEKTPRKIKTGYLVSDLIYVPLFLQERVIGVLSADNRKSGRPLKSSQIHLLSTLADYAAIAIENARLYSHVKIERNQLETILTKIEEGVIIIDHDKRLLLVNRKARSVFELGEANLTAKRLQEVLPHQELVEALTENVRTSPFRMEIVLDDGLVFNAQITPIPEVGLAVTMQDITHLKELDRIKSDFVNTVSHDLRSPLTAILGYVELIDRVGPVNEQQNEFIRRVQVSVHSITSLINDLLDLGRIEAGFDTRKEIVSLNTIIRYAIDSLRNRIADKSQQVIVDVPEGLPQVLGNPIRLRQMVSNLLNNSIKYTPKGGEICIRIKAEDRQMILQVADNGPGIPPGDQPYIFDKFYRGSNVTGEIPGSGLGLAIVKSIVENHQGRIWVDSAPGEGTTFTVVLPIYDEEL